MKHINLNDEFRNKLLESAAWGKIGLNLNEGKVEEGQESLNEEVDAQGYEVIQDQEEQVSLEEGEAHVCPLCTSLLPEAIEEERVLEHLEIVANVLDRISQINESDEDLDTIIAECVREVLLESEVDDMIDEDEDAEISEDEFDSDDEDSDDDQIEEESMGYESPMPKGKGKAKNMSKKMSSKGKKC
jgi:hypothetical protein